MPRDSFDISDQMMREVRFEETQRLFESSLGWLRRRTLGQELLAKSKSIQTERTLVLLSLPRTDE